MTDIMTPKDKKSYVHTRKLHPVEAIEEDQIKNLQGIHIYNGFESHELPVDHLKDYQPENGAERYFYNKDTIITNNAKSKIRLQRDIDQIKYLEKELKRPLMHIHHKGGSEAEASLWFETKAHNLARTIGEELKQNKDTIKKNKHVAIMFGPLQYLEGNKVRQDEFLSYTIEKWNGIVTVRYDYPFGDQEQTMLRKTFDMMNAIVPGTQPHIFHYGKMGLLREDLNINDICLPTGALDIENLDGQPLRIRNELIDDSEIYSIFINDTDKGAHEGITINSNAVLQQTEEQLRAAQEKGDFLDMETILLEATRMGFNTNWRNLKTPKFYLANIASDHPLKGANLGNTDYDHRLLNMLSNSYQHIITTLHKLD